MAEYKNVEKPFLEKLEQLVWQVIDQNQGFPHDPTLSLRKSFREVTLKEEFKKAICSINLVNGQKWLTDKQLDDVYDEITAKERQNDPLLESNQYVFERLIGKEKVKVAKNKLTGENDVTVKLIDFDNWDNNSFIAINQFRVTTPGGPREGIIPDIVLFVNGLPFLVIECKDVDVSEPLSESFIQIQRYANTREDDFGIKGRKVIEKNFTLEIMIERIKGFLED